jgi:hypothetical protein
MISRVQLRRQQHFLDRHLTIQELVVSSPDSPHAALPDRLGEQIPPTNQNSRPTHHGGIIADKLAYEDLVMHGTV